MISSNYLDRKTIIVSSKSPKHEGLILHGYGSNKEEMLGLAINLANNLDLKLLIFDLPGHGDNAETELNLDNALAQINKSLIYIKNPSFFIGHSMGANLGLITKLPVAVTISIPGDAYFDNSRQEMLRILRAKRVKEKSSYFGLREILKEEIKPAAKTLMLKAGNDLKTVNDLAQKWQNQGIECANIKNTNHLDIISYQQTFNEIKKWLTQNL